MDISSKQIIVKDLAATTGGNITVDTGTFTIGSGVPTDDVTVYRLTGSVTLTSNLEIITTGTLLKNLQIEIWNEAVVNLGANKYRIFGKQVPDEYAGIPFIAKCLYNGVAWDVLFFASGASSGHVNTNSIADGSVTAVKLASDSVETAKIKNDAVTTSKILDGAVITGKINSLAVSTAKLADGGVTAIKLGTDSVETIKIKDGNVTTAKIADSSITTPKIAAGAVTAAKLAGNINKTSMYVFLPFDKAARVGVLNFRVCFDCTIDMIIATVQEPALGDPITLIFKDNSGTELTNSQIDVTTSHVLGNQITSSPTANNTFSAGDKITIEGSKTTKTSGAVGVTFCMTKI